MWCWFLRPPLFSQMGSSQEWFLWKSILLIEKKNHWSTLLILHGNHTKLIHCSGDPLISMDTWRSLFLTTSVTDESSLYIYRPIKKMIMAIKLSWQSYAWVFFYQNLPRKARYCRHLGEKNLQWMLSLVIYRYIDVSKPFLLNIWTLFLFVFIFNPFNWFFVFILQIDDVFNDNMQI